MLELSVIFPAYNEVERIQPTLESYDKVLSQMGKSYELLVVDDGSDDGTANFVENLKSKLPNIRVIRCEINRGKGNAVRVGMLHAKGAICIMTDSDGSIPANHLEALLAPIYAKEAEISIGSRYVEGAIVEEKQPLHRRLWSRFANAIIQRILLPGIVDTQCGFKAFEGKLAKELFAKAEIEGWSFDLEILALAQMHGYRIAEIPVHWSDDKRSKGHLAQLPKTIRELFKIKKRMKRELAMS